MFGSVLRDDFRPESDVDVLVEFEPEQRYTYFTLAQIEDEVPGEWARNPKRVSAPFDSEYGEDSLHFSYNYPELLKLLN